MEMEEMVIETNEVGEDGKRAAGREEDRYTSRRG